MRSAHESKQPLDQASEQKKNLASSISQFELWHRTVVFMVVQGNSNCTLLHLDGSARNTAWNHSCIGNS